MCGRRSTCTPHDDVVAGGTGRCPGFADRDLPAALAIAGLAGLLEVLFAAMSFIALGSTCTALDR